MPYQATIAGESGWVIGQGCRCNQCTARIVADTAFEDGAAEPGPRGLDASVDSGLLDQFRRALEVLGQFLDQPILERIAR